MKTSEKIIQELVDEGIVKVVDGLITSRKNIIDLVQKDSLTEEERVNLMFEVNVFLSCAK